MMRETGAPKRAPVFIPSITVGARLLGPSLPRGVISWKPRVTSVAHAGGAANQNLAMSRDEVVQRGAGAFRLHPMERAPDRHDVELAEVGGQSFSPALDQAQAHAGAVRCLTCGCDHRWLGVHA